MKFLGLDISTSCTGICLLSDNDILSLDFIDLSKCKTLWLKADVTRNKLMDIFQKFGNIDVLSIEEPLMGFQKGMSSAATIATLMKFNGMTSLISRDIFGIDPEYISAAHARKLCGIKIQRTSIAGMSGKEQVFKYMAEHDLKHIQWPLKKSGKIVDWSRDATDSYCVAKASSISRRLKID